MSVLNEIEKLKTKATQAFKTLLGEGLRQTILYPVLSCFTPLEVRGLENLQTAGPFIFAPNHSSHLDAPLLLAALPLHLRLHTKVAAAFDYFFNAGWKGTLVSTLINAFPFVRKGAGTGDSLLEAQQLLNGGNSLLIFPEGTRTQDGHLQTFKRGVGKLATATNAAIVPVWIEGTYTAFPKGAFWPRQQRVVITFGKPLKFAPSQDPTIVAESIQLRVQNLLAQSLLAQSAKQKAA